MRESIEPRYYSGFFQLPKKPKHRQVFVNTLLKPYKFVVLMGMPGTGKTTFAKSYNPPHEETLTIWNREPIFRMIFTGGERDEKYNSYLQTMEADLIGDLLKRDDHKVIIDGWNRMPSGRKVYRSLFPENLGKTLCVVFDGPTGEILRRVDNMEKYSMMDATDRQMFVEDKHSTMVFPKPKEGWHDIFYINTFDDKGVEYLKPRLVKKFNVDKL